MIIAKQNMTTLVDRLMKDELVERRFDATDRRVVNIFITEKGIKFLKESMLGLKKIVGENLANLNDEDINSLYSAFRTIRTISLKL